MASSEKGEGEGNSIQFKHFDVVPEASDHHYIVTNKKSKKCFNGNSTLYCHVMKEWKILERNLPESIYVQAYETRIDLLRAVIIGPDRTPYHDGLFFFDFVLPSDYPRQPPKVFYHSYGYRLNPNLYADGKVCLSLINTWVGNTCETWGRNSTILQILVSIQGLVLNEHPYFNEPGHEMGKISMSSQWITKSNDYNESAFILSCWTMLQAMHRPPENFEGFVNHHFHTRADSILAAVKAYGGGHAMVGQFHKDVLSCSASEIKVSEKFKVSLAEADAKLKKEFEKRLLESKTGNKTEKAMNEECGKATGNINVRKGRHGKNAAIGVKAEENGGQHKTWSLSNLLSCVKWFRG